MNRLLRPFGLKLGPLQAGAVYFPIHFFAVGIGLTLLIAPQGVGVFWPATGSLFAFLLLYPAALLARAAGFHASGPKWPAHQLFAPQIPYSVAGMLFFVKFAAAVLGAWLCKSACAARFPLRDCAMCWSSRRRRWCRRWCARSLRSVCAATPAGQARLLALGAELVDRRLPRRAGGHTAAAHHRHPRRLVLGQRARRTRRHVLGLRGVGAVAGAGVPAHRWR